LAHCPFEAGTLLVVEFGSDTHRRKMVRPAQHHSGNAAVLDTGWIRRGHEVLGVSAKVTGDPDQLRVPDNLCSRHGREVMLIGVMLTGLNVLHLRFPSPDTERAHVQWERNLTRILGCHDALLEFNSDYGE
jgi:hypothetical protein